MTTAEQFVSFGQANLEAMMKSSQIWTAGVQELSAKMAASAQASLDETLSTMRAMSGVKSLRDAVELQTGLARSAMEKTVSETGRLAETSIKLAEHAAAPIAARLTAAVDMVSPRA